MKRSGTSFVEQRRIKYYCPFGSFIQSLAHTSMIVKQTKRLSYDVMVYIFEILRQVSKLLKVTQTQAE